MPTKRQKRQGDLPPERTISTTAMRSRHPLNVRPLGNLLLALAEKGPSRDQQLGDLGRLPEEVLMEIFGFVDDPLSLMRFSHVLRVAYAYLYDEDFWRRLYTRHQGELPDPIVWRGLWRRSVLQLDPGHEARPLCPGNLLCLDLLYRPVQCAQVDYETLFAHIIREEQHAHESSLQEDPALGEVLPGRIPRVWEATLDETKFALALHKQPFILANRDEARWPRWDLGRLLERFGDVRFRQEAVQWPLLTYAQYLAHNSDESPLYLFDCASRAVQTLRAEYTVPAVFTSDHFEAFGEYRPNYAWLIVGLARLGSTFHKDPNHTLAWNAVLAGRKLWVMFPPTVAPPGVATDADEAEVTCPVGLAEWVLAGFFNDAVRLPDAQIAVTFPGECMYVPSGWWHAVINIDDGVALTQNFVPQPKLASVLRFLKEKPAQVSGFTPLAVRRACLQFDSAETQPPLFTEQDLEAIRTYAAAYDSAGWSANYQDEDCGELPLLELPTLPIYEIFKGLLVAAGSSELLEKGLAEMDALCGGSAWQKLAASTGFTFGFDED